MIKSLIHLKFKQFKLVKINSNKKHPKLYQKEIEQ